MTSHYIAL
ncbi:hemolysin, partial [Vibrio cholerae HC-62B1]